MTNAKESAEDRKTRLEADLLEIELEQKRAEAELAQLEIEKKKAELELDTASLERRNRLGKLDHEYQVRKSLVGNELDDTRVYTFDDGVDEVSARTIIAKLDYWAIRDRVAEEKRDILIRFKSPGGSVIDGLDIFDHVMEMRSNGYRIDTMVTGLAASMAGVLLQMGETRYMRANSTLHLHEVATMSFGKASELKDKQAFTDMLQRRICEIYADRTEGKHTAESVQELMERREVYLLPQEALEHGFIDAIV